MTEEREIEEGLRREPEISDRQQKMISEEEVGTEQIRALAEQLAPQERELNELMDDPLLASSSSGDNISPLTPLKMEGDDDMDQELEHLTYSEDILRRELDSAKDFASFFGSNQSQGAPYDLIPSALFESPLSYARAEVYSPVERCASTDHNHCGPTFSGSPQHTPHASIQCEEADIDHDQDAEDEQVDDKDRNIFFRKESTENEDIGKVQPQTVDGATSSETEMSAIHVPRDSSRDGNTTPNKQQPLSEYHTPSPPYQRTSSLIRETPQKSVVLFRSPGKVYSSTEHFNRLMLSKEPQGAWYSVDLTMHVANIDSKDLKQKFSAYAGMGIKEYCLSISEWKRLFVGLVLEEEKRSTQMKQQKGQKQATPVGAHVPEQNDPITLATRKAAVRTISIRLRPDVLCGAVMDAVAHTLANSKYSSIIRRQGGHLQGTVQGLIPSYDDNTNGASTSFNNSGQGKSETVCKFLVDVQLCTQKSVNCERVLLVRVYHWNKEQSGVKEEDLWSPSSASAIDAISTKMGIPEDRFESFSDFAHENPLPDLEEQRARGQEANLHLREACALIQRIESPNLAKNIRPLSQKTDSEEYNLSELVSEHLLQNYRACPSVLHPNTAITLPSLSPQDWQLIQASWDWVQSLWNELETRELIYWVLLGLPNVPEPPVEANEDDTDGTLLSMSTERLPSPRFGAFPALPTLDVHYCSQLRRLSRENMIGQLLKAASVLEEYARQAEYQCANLIDLLRPTFGRYKVDPPSLPKPAPLAAYMLEYTPPQAQCPPWGSKVMEALNRVASMSHSTSQGEAISCAHDAMQSVITTESLPSSGGVLATSDTLESVSLAEAAVQAVYDAFQRQDDEEHSARLARKNLQVMDRLAKMEEHRKACIQALSTAETGASIAAADDFISIAENASIGLHGVVVEQNGEQISATPWWEVPLLKWNVGVGGSSGTCTITANQLLFTPAKLIPLLGRSQSTWFCLRDVEFDFTPSHGSLLNRLSTVHVMHRGTGVEAYSFRPSYAGQRLRSFLDTLQKGVIEAGMTNKGNKTVSMSD